jgi:hypothetical protein
MNVERTLENACPVRILGALTFTCFYFFLAVTYRPLTCRVDVDQLPFKKLFVLSGYK